MPYYTDNTNLIGPGKIFTQTGVYDIDYARINPGGTGSPPIAINFAIGNSVAFPGTQAQYAASAGTIIPTTVNYAFDSGYHYFDLLPGTYNVNIKGAEGSGNVHGRGANINAVLVVTTSSRFVAIVGNPGTGSYGAGGMSAIALRNNTSDVYTNAIPIIVAGGGGGGYTSASGQAQADAGHVSDSSVVRRGSATDGPSNLGVYDGGGAFSNVYSPIRYNNVIGVQGDVGAQHFVWGATGGRSTPCGSGVGGFGGGGGSCPGGGGGYYGGKAGGDTPSGTPGGGGTSYRLDTAGTAYISSWSSAGYNGANTGNPGTAGGFFSITPAV